MIKRHFHKGFHGGDQFLKISVENKTKQNKKEVEEIRKKARGRTISSHAIGSTFRMNQSMTYMWEKTLEY